jgi:hypothetical protein
VHACLHACVRVGFDALLVATFIGFGLPQSGSAVRCNRRCGIPAHTGFEGLSTQKPPHSQPTIRVPSTGKALVKVVTPTRTAPCCVRLLPKGYRSLCGLCGLAGIATCMMYVGMLPRLLFVCLMLIYGVSSAAPDMCYQQRAPVEEAEAMTQTAPIIDTLYSVAPRARVPLAHSLCTLWLTHTQVACRGHRRCLLFRRRSSDADRHD